MSQNLSEEILELLSKESTQISFKENPHRESTKKYNVFKTASKATSVGEAKTHGASAWDLREWYKKSALDIQSPLNPLKDPSSLPNQFIPTKQEFSESESSNLISDRRREQFKKQSSPEHVQHKLHQINQLRQIAAKEKKQAEFRILSPVDGSKSVGGTPQAGRESGFLSSPKDLTSKLNSVSAEGIHGNSSDSGIPKSSPSEGPATLSAIEDLLTKSLNPVKSSIDSIQKDIQEIKQNTVTKQELKEELIPIQDEIDDLKERVNGIQISGAHDEDFISKEQMQMMNNQDSA